MLRLALVSRVRLSSLLVLAAFSLAAFAHAGSHNKPSLEQHKRHAAALSPRNNTTSALQKRFEGSRFTYYYINGGENACGSWDSDDDFIVALTQTQWDGGSHCYAPITIEYQGRTANAKITDECPGCPYGALDLSPGLFKFLAGGSLDAGVLYGSWNFGSGAPTTTSKPAPPPTTTHHKTTSSPPPPPPSSTSHADPTTSKTFVAAEVSSTHKSSSSTHPSSSSHATTSSAPPSSSSKALPSTTTSSAPATTTTVTSFDTGNIEQLNLAIIQLAGLVGAGAASANGGA
ncbi:hypothetical protein BV20DRAFT_962789 [Pilatotrama ljubarskyi]|nr:hypothetical protein BV20DRAFT_962789 [Pilatotrama ljubarskyi]